MKVLQSNLHDNLGAGAQDFEFDQLPGTIGHQRLTMNTRNNLRGRGSLANGAFDAMVPDG